MNYRTELVLRAILLGPCLAGSAFAIQYFCTAIGISRDTGLWIWAGVAVLLIGLVMGPMILRVMPARQAIIFAVTLLLAGAGVYLYIVYVQLPAAIARANSS